MNREDLLRRIWIDPQRCFGKPCIRGHRIWVSLILDLLASGSSVAEIQESYPGLTETDIQACIAYGAEMARERYVDVPLQPASARSSNSTRISDSAASNFFRRSDTTLPPSPSNIWKRPLIAI